MVNLYQFRLRIRNFVLFYNAIFFNGLLADRYGLNCIMEYVYCFYGIFECFLKFNYLLTWVKAIVSQVCMNNEYAWDNFWSCFFRRSFKVRLIPKMLRHYIYFQLRRSKMSNNWNTSISIYWRLQYPIWPKKIIIACRGNPWFRNRLQSEFH